MEQGDRLSISLSSLLLSLLQPLTQTLPLTPPLPTCPLPLSTLCPPRCTPGSLNPPQRASIPSLPSLFLLLAHPFSMAGQDLQQLLWLMHYLLDQQVLCLQPVTFLHPREQVCAWTGGRQGGGGFCFITHSVKCAPFPCECSVQSLLLLRGQVKAFLKHFIFPVHLAMITAMLLQVRTC